MSTHHDGDTISKLRMAEIERLSKLPSFPDEPPPEKGVLLSDRIREYCEKYQLISPFDENQLRPAVYALSVGRNYSIGGKQEALNDGMPLRIEPYQVAIIETFETINMPKYLIGRWNIQVKRAYKGLLWVGGAQVDPGFRGYLCCPIYNLSTEAVTLHFRDTLAVIDFVTTTPYQEGRCLEFDWAGRKMLVFPQYGQLSSGIEEKVRDFDKRIEDNKAETRADLASGKTKLDESLSDIRARIDNFVTLTFTVVAILFAALAIIATKGSDQPFFVGSSVLVAAIALFVALWAHIAVRRDRANAQAGRWYSRLVPGFVALVAWGVIVSASLFFDTYRARVAATELQQAKERASRAVDAVNQEKKDREAETGELRRQINLLQQGQAKRK